MLCIDRPRSDWMHRTIAKKHQTWASIADFLRTNLPYQKVSIHLCPGEELVTTGKRVLRELVDTGWVAALRPEDFATDRVQLLVD